jgi:hypothetical protein
MGYGRDDREGGDRWRERNDGNGNRGYGRGGYEGGYGHEHGREHGHHHGRDHGRGGYGGGGGGDDRGFLDRAGDEVRSWFGDDDAQRRRESDERRWERERGMTGGRDNGEGSRGDHGPGTLGGGGFGGGWGNQQGDSWNAERPGVREGSFTDSIGSARNEGGDRDRGRYGAYGAGGQHGGSQSGGSRGGSGYADTMRHGGDHSHGLESGGHRGGDLHDPHYSQWRQRQIEELDRDYAEYRREHQSKFEQEFGSWRTRRQGQRQSLGKVGEKMEVVGSDGNHVGTVDKVGSDDRIVLTRSDANAGGVHHSIPCGWVESVDEKVTLNRTADQAFAEWREEERSRALFEREDSGSDGPHTLNRSFSGTYDEGKK